MEIPISKVTKCANFSKSAASYITHLRDNGLWPLEEQCREKSISVIFQQISNMPDIRSIPCSSFACYACKNVSFGTILKKRMEKIMGIKRGLCLDCVKAFGKFCEDKECRLCVPKFPDLSLEQ